MAATPQFAATPKVGQATISTANANRDGTGTLGTVLTAGTNGTRISRINIQATATTTAGMVRLFLHDGTTAHPFNEVPVAAITPSATLPAFVSNINEYVSTAQLPMTIPSGWSLRAATEKAETFRVIAWGADL